MEHSFITTPEQAERLAQRRAAMTVRFKRESFDALGLGLSLGEARDAVCDFDGRQKLWRLVRVRQEPSDPDVVDTGWVEAPRREEWRA